MTAKIKEGYVWRISNDDPATEEDESRTTTDDQNIKFTIAPMDISYAAKISAEGTFKTLDDLKKALKVVPSGDLKPVQGKDYDIAYGKVISNKAKVTVAGKGNYTGSISETFVIGGDRPAKKYTITFDFNGGKLNGVKGVIKEKHYENTIVKMRKPSRSGYKFKYWKGKVNGKVKKYKAGTRLKVKGDRRYKAIWKKKAVYKKSLAVMKSKGDDSFEITWTKVKGASGYDIFFSACNTKYKKHKPERVATAGKSAKRIFKINVLKKHVAYKAYVKGSCKIYAVAANGASKKIKVKVR